MILLPDPVWPVWLLAGALLVDAVLSVRPPKFIRECLDGVWFPREWWWILITVKAVATAGLLIGLVVPGVAVAASAGVVAYFGCAVVAHIRARFFTSALWVNCLGMLGLALVSLTVPYVGAVLG